jgi:hypothetical protein
VLLVCYDTQHNDTRYKHAEHSLRHAALRHQQIGLNREKLMSVIMPSMPCVVPLLVAYRSTHPTRGGGYLDVQEGTPIGLAPE